VIRLLATAFAFALLLQGCASTGARTGGGGGRSVADPTAVEAAADALDRLAAYEPAALADPPRHPTHPARNRQLVIPSGPVRPELGRPPEMNALMLVAAGEGPKPTLLLLHGLPGNERNLDLAQAVRRTGWNVLTFTYRGAWGSEGIFSFQHAVADSKAALDFLRSERAASEFKVDPSRIVLAGHSMGGYMAAHTAANDPSSVAHPEERLSPGKARLEGPPVAGLILLDAWDIAATARQVKSGGAAGRAGFIAAMDDLGHALGPITAADLADNLIRRGEEWDLAALAPKLARMPVLSIYATHGGAEENRELALKLGAAGAALTARELDSDHAFADSRVRLAAEVAGWLKALERAR
jgi:pimeloyl-ACP methyl ester carboxylesterase